MKTLRLILELLKALWIELKKWQRKQRQQKIENEIRQAEDDPYDAMNDHFNGDQPDKRKDENSGQ